MNNTPNANRKHIGLFGRRNAGKSSLINAITNQQLAVVSDVKGTTTDPVYKAMELLPIGPVVIIDTPGFDDEGDLGTLRVKKAKQVLNKTDVAILVADSEVGLTDTDNQLIELFKAKEIPYLIAFNKSDVKKIDTLPENAISVSASTKDGVENLKERIAKLALIGAKENCLVSDLLTDGDTVVLVTPIDSSAPKGRLILPQQQVIRDILDSNATAVVIKEDKLTQTLENLVNEPKMVITDSQVFKRVSKDTPKNISLTSFSILMARYKGFLKSAVEGVSAVKRLNDGDKVLISEGCTHHRQCEDIGTVKIPKWLREYTGKNLDIEFSSGTEFPENLSEYSLIIHCGGCMLNDREMIYRTKCADDAGVPMTNYGILIAHINGILSRSIELFPDISALIKK